MQRVNQHARPSIIQVGCPTCCYQVCALDRVNVGTADLDYSSGHCHRFEYSCIQWHIYLGRMPFLMCDFTKTTPLGQMLISFCNFWNIIIHISWKVYVTVLFKNVFRQLSSHNLSTAKYNVKCVYTGSWKILHEITLIKQSQEFPVIYSNDENSFQPDSLRVEMFSIL